MGIIDDLKEELEMANEMGFVPGEFLEPVISNEIDIRIKLDEGVKCPVYAHEGDSGFDILARKTVKFNKFQTRLVPTGIYLEIPKGYECQIRPRSGISLKTPFRIANAPGTIDSNYRGEVGIIIQNVSSRQLVVKEGTKIAQGVIVPVMHAKFSVVEDLENSNRGADGFGSTDKGE
jgi:dUTP pyrophosphatase